MFSSYKDMYDSISDEKKLIDKRLDLVHYANEFGIRQAMRFYHCSRNTVRKWCKRYAVYGIKGLKNKSRRPLHSPRRIKEEDIIKIKQTCDYAKEKKKYIQRLSKVAKVYISSEGELDQELEQYRLPVAYDQIHQVLYYATLVISEGASMASEAAVLGTHAFYLNSIQSGTTNEQEEKFGLLRVMHDPRTRYEQALIEAEKMLADSSLRVKGKEKREKMLAEMEEPNKVFMDVIKNEICVEK